MLKIQISYHHKFTRNQNTLIQQMGVSKLLLFIGIYIHSDTGLIMMSQ